jgi:hypothetical protein
MTTVSLIRIAVAMPTGRCRWVAESRAPLSLGFGDTVIRVAVVYSQRGIPIMASDTDETRNFALRESSGDETSVFSGRTPRQAALKAARQLEPAPSEQEAPRAEIVLREKGTEKTHIYEGWAWEDDAPEDKPDWMPERITEANVSKQGINHLDEI